MASAADKITDIRNSGRPNSARVTSSRSSGGTTLACDNLTGWPTASKVHFVTYQLDTNSNPVSGTQLDCQGIVSGSNIGTFTVIDGTDNGNAIGDVVEMLPTAAWGQDLADALTNEHSRTGTHTAITGTSANFTGAVSTDTISEHTAATGVTIDGLAIKDSQLVTANSVVTANYTDGSILPEHLTTGVGTTWAWQSWTPTLSGLFTDAKWTKTCKYIQIGKTVNFRMQLIANAASPMAGSNDAVFTLPVTAVDYAPGDKSYTFGDGGYWNAASSIGRLAASMLTTTTASIRTSGLATLTSTVPITWASGHYITITGTYEAA